MDELTAAVDGYLQKLCSYPDRHPGRPGNRAATELFARVAAESGLDVEVDELDCMDCRGSAARLAFGGTAALPAGLRPGPYSLACDVAAPLTQTSTLAELEAGGLAGTILLLHGELCREQLTPRGYPFYEMPEHVRILDALEAARPAAIVAATGRDPNLAGGLYPFPLIEDARVDIPNAYLTDVEGRQLLARVGERAELRIESERIAGRLQHVVARAPGSGSGRVVVFGHVDTKAGTPGALDNATGAAALMALATLLRGFGGEPTVELVAVNGEDYYDATGERRFAADNAGRWDEIVLGLNADGAGWRDHATEISLYGCDDRLAGVVRAAMALRPGFVEGEAWFQSDHGLFLINGRPAVAVTSSGFAELCAGITHTSADSLDLADPEKVAQIARFYADVVATLP
jgi:aminopeptidase YwaD